MTPPIEKREKNIDLLDVLIEQTRKSYVDAVNRFMFSDLPMFEKPKRYYTVPRFIIRIPYLKLDTEYDSEWGEGRKGLFLEWKEIRIGRKKILNAHYKDEMKRYRPGRYIKFTRYQGLK